MEKVANGIQNKPSQVGYELFPGSSTTIIAAEITGRAFELDLLYVNV